MIVAQGLSYATLAGVPAVYGLYGAFTPSMAYALVGTSKQLAVGPVAVTSILIGSNMKTIVPCSADITNANQLRPDQVRVGTHTDTRTSIHTRTCRHVNTHVQCACASEREPGLEGTHGHTGAHMGTHGHTDSCAAQKQVPEQASASRINRVTHVQLCVPGMYRRMMCPMC